MKKKKLILFLISHNQNIEYRAILDIKLKTRNTQLKTSKETFKKNIYPLVKTLKN